jgi:phosphoglycolate phosphatase
MSISSLLDLPVDSSEVAGMVAEYREHYGRTAASNTTIFDGVPQLLEALGATHRMAVATTKAEHLAVPLLEALGLAGHFEVVAGPGPDALTETKTDTLGRTLERLKTFPRERTTMIGDRHHDIEAAHHHGLRSIAVTYGYGTLDELEAAAPHALVASPSEFLALLAPT